MCLRGSTDSDHGPAVGGAFGWVREPRPGTFYLFLGRSQFELSGFFRHPGTGRGKGGPHHQDPGNHCGIASGSHRADVRLSQKRRDSGVSRQQLGGRGPKAPILLAGEEDERERGVARPPRAAGDRWSHNESCARSRCPRPPRGRGGA